MIRSNLVFVSAAAVLVAGCAACPQAQSSLGAAPLPASPVRSAAPAKEGAPHAIVRQQNYRIEQAPMALEVDPNDGGRIVEFSLEGRSAIVPVSESPEAYASSFWPSPQSAWSWPPPPEFDKLPWKVDILDRVLQLTSETSKKLHFSARQRISTFAGMNAVSVEFQITNHDSAPHKVAPWQNTRVRPKGLTFYPSAEPSYAQSSLKLSPVNGITWYAHDPATVKDSLKSYADGKEGWMAQVDGDLLFVKVFTDVPRDAQAPEEGEVVIYVPGSGLFVEMEQQGAYTELAPGASLTWPVIFVLQQVPKNVDIKAGNPQLVELARHMAATVR